jgi:hypothetical protein
MPVRFPFPAPPSDPQGLVGVVPHVMGVGKPASQFGLFFTSWFHALKIVNNF